MQVAATDASKEFLVELDVISIWCFDRDDIIFPHNTRCAYDRAVGQVKVKICLETFGQEHFSVETHIRRCLYVGINDCVCIVVFPLLFASDMDDAVFGDFVYFSRNLGVVKGFQNVRRRRRRLFCIKVGAY